MFSDTDRIAVAQAIASAEANTSGEIVCIVNEHRHYYAATGLGIAAVLAFLLPLLGIVLGVDPLHLLPGGDWSAGDPALDLRRGIEAYAEVQVALFCVVAALLVLTPLGAWLTPQHFKHARVRSEALAQFRARGIGDTRARTGVLIYVSTPDRIAEVVADEGIYAKVDSTYWRATVAALIAGISAGAPVRGFTDAVGLAGKVLAEHFPATAGDNPNELPDRLIVL